MLKQRDNAPIVMPYPKDMQLSGGSIAITTVSIIAAGEDARRAAEILESGLSTSGVTCTEGYEISLVSATELDDEAYELSVTSDGTRIAASGYAGFYYGVQTLLQLINIASGEAPQVPLLQISDSPLKPMRGIHTYLPAREDLPFFKRFIEWLGRHKMNTMFLEIGGGMEYSRHPEINQAWEKFCAEAMEYPGGPDGLQASQWFAKDSTHVELAGGSYLLKDECRMIAEWCDDNCIEIIPEAQSLSHAYYLVLAHPELAEVPEDPWPDNYCPSNPASYELYFDVLEEVIEVFDPRTISIGHDEAYIFCFCDECKKRDAAEIYATDIIKAHDFLAERNIRTAIWGDKLLNIHHPNGITYGGVERRMNRYGREHYQPPTNSCVDMLPRDILILDWYWSLSYESAGMLAEKGFELIYGNYHAPSFADWAKYRSNPALQGGETSLWCLADEYSIGRNGAFHRILWAANNLWSDFDPDSDRDALLSDIATIMRRDRLFLGNRSSVISGPDATRQHTIDLIPAAAGGMYPGEVPEYDFSVIPKGKSVLGDVQFDVPGAENYVGPLPVVDWHNRATNAIPIGRCADALAFLHTTTAKFAHAPTYYSLNLGPNIIGHYLVTYADGQTVEIPLEYAYNIDSINTAFMVGKSGDQSETIGATVYAADPVLSGEMPGGQYTLFMYEWVNPRPDVPVQDVRMLWNAGYAEGIIALLALTAIEKAR